MVISLNYFAIYIIQKINSYIDSFTIYLYTIRIGSENVFPPTAMVNKTSFVTISSLPIDF